MCGLDLWSAQGQRIWWSRCPVNQSVLWGEHCLLLAEFIGILVAIGEHIWKQVIEDRLENAGRFCAPIRHPCCCNTQTGIFLVQMFNGKEGWWYSCDTTFDWSEQWGQKIRENFPLRILHSQLEIVSHQIHSDCWENKWWQIASITINWHLVYASMGKWPCLAVSSLGSCLGFLFGAVNPVSEESLLNFKPQLFPYQFYTCSMNHLFVLPTHDLYWRPEVRKALLQPSDTQALFCPLYWLGLSHLMKQVSGV
jgi:hypothetical protein